MMRRVSKCPSWRPLKEYCASKQSISGVLAYSAGGDGGRRRPEFPAQRRMLAHTGSQLRLLRGDFIFVGRLAVPVMAVRDGRWLPKLLVCGVRSSITRT